MKIKDFLDLPKTKEKYIDSFMNRLNLFEVYDNKLNDLNVYELDINRLEVYNVFSDSIDGRRGLWIYFLYFDNEPITFWYEAGREGDDENLGFVLNKIKFNEAINYLNTFKDFYNKIEEIDINEDIIDLDEIYGYDLSKNLFKVNHNLKFKINDVVEIKNFSMLNLKNEIIKAKIIKVDSKTNKETYLLDLIDYKIVQVFNHNTNNSLPRHLYKKDYKVKWEDIDKIHQSYDELEKQQKEIINKVINSNKQVTIFISYQDEKNMELYIER